MWLTSSSSLWLRSDVWNETRLAELLDGDDFLIVMPIFLPPLPGLWLSACDCWALPGVNTCNGFWPPLVLLFPKGVAWITRSASSSVPSSSSLSELSNSLVTLDDKGGTTGSFKRLPLLPPDAPPWLRKKGYMISLTSKTEALQMPSATDVLPRLLQSCYTDLLAALLPMHFCGIWPCSR